MSQLKRDDSGEGSDWVVGLVGSVPRFEDSFHELGIASVVGKHVVLRAISNAAEYQAIETGLSELAEEERAKLRRARLTHKTAAVLLHELGHTLGALHERDETNLMNPVYAKSVGHFSPDALAVMHVALEHRTDSGTLDAAGQRAVLAFWEHEPNPWIAAERASAARALQASVPKPAVASATNESESDPSPRGAALPVPSNLAAADARTYDAAERALAGGDADGASRLAQPLFARYAGLPAIDDLRCRIAMGRGLSWASTQRECAGLMQGVPAFHETRSPLR